MNSTNNKIFCITKTPKKITQFNELTPKKNSTNKINYYETYLSKYNTPTNTKNFTEVSPQKLITHKLNLNDAIKINIEQACQILDKLYNNGLPSSKFLIYGSVAQQLQNLNHKEKFGDIDFAVSHQNAETAHKEFKLALDKLNLKYELTGNTFSIKNSDDESFFNLQLVTSERNELHAFPNGVLAYNSNTFEDDAKEVIIYEGKEYPCIKKTSLEKNNFPKIINHPKYDNKEVYSLGGKNLFSDFNMVSAFNFNDDPINNTQASNTSSTLKPLNFFESFFSKK